MQESNLIDAAGERVDIAEITADANDRVDAARIAHGVRPPLACGMIMLTPVSAISVMAYFTRPPRRARRARLCGA
jgi:hypothetical protein